MSLSTIKSGLFFYCVGLILRGDIANAAAQDLPDLATIARGIAINQDSLRNLEIKHFILKEEQRPSDTAEWEPIKQTVEGNAWYDGLPNSKVRIQITRRISEWQNGLAPWIEQQQDVGYDGQMGRVVNIRSGPPGRLSDCNTAQLLPGVPVQIHDAIQPYADGTAFCLNYFSIPDTKNRSLAKIFSDAARLGAKWPIQWETIYGVKTIKVTDGTPAYGGFLFWFDPNAGYALRKFQSEYRLPGKDWVLQREMEIPDLIEAGKGFWFPSRAICIQPYYGKFGWQIRLSYHVEKVIANNPSFDPHVFTVPFPPNYFVSDEVNGGSFYTKSAKATENAIDRAVAKLKDEDLSHLPTSTNPSAIANVPMDNIQQESVVSLTHRFPAAIAIVLAILGAAVLIFVVGVWRRFHARLRLVLMAAVLCTAGVGRAAYADEMLDPTGDVVEPNCGVYDTCFCLRWFGRAAGIRDVGRLLHSGDRLEQRCSLEEMQIAFADYNIEATGLRADNLNDHQSFRSGRQE
ncbi:MAG TPA: hypothetical protein VHX86_00065 [Tepidisphaeraceae bacterium]|jgi:hypothetical protein|nr:hypothetical protein [Tepidisphaeraceae bacterium]